MIKIGIVDLSGLIDTADRGKIKSVQSKFARLLLEELCSGRFENSALPETVKGKFGKPRFVCGAPQFNIAHEGNLAAVIVSEDKEVGIDLQSLPHGLTSREKIEQRLTKIIRDCDYYFTRGGASEPENAEILFFEAEGEDKIKPSANRKGISIHGEPQTLSAGDADFLREWSELEALMKLSGGGFSDVGKIPEILATASIKTLWICDTGGVEYALCYACAEQ